MNTADMARFRTLKPLKSNFHPDMVYPVGSDVVLLEPVDAAHQVWLVEVWVPDETLVGGVSFDVVQANLSDLAPSTAGA